MYYQVIPTKIFRQDLHALESLLTYSFPEKLKPGQIVLIPLGKSIIPGIIHHSTTPPQDQSFQIKAINSVLPLPPIPTHLLRAATWLSEYYLTPLPLIANLLLPKGITRERRKKALISPLDVGTHSTIIPLNSSQQAALTVLENIKSHTKLLHGITGSGKTNLYLTLVMKEFQKQRSSIILVPEISLTSQLVQQFQFYFPNSVITIHSKQTEATRHQIWQRIIKSTAPLIIIGPRSALFSPLNNLGLIIIDEAHDPAYYQASLRTLKILIAYTAPPPLLLKIFILHKKIMPTFHSLKKLKRPLFRLIYTLST